MGSHSVGITLSQTCLTLLHANYTTSCPTYADLVQLDNSNIQWSGGFTEGYRDKPPVSNSWRLYDYSNEFLVFVDPPAGYSARIKNIVIESNFDVYFQPDSYSSVFMNHTVESDTQKECITWAPTNKSDICVQWEPKKYNVTKPYRILYHDRYINESCDYAVINADKYEMLVADTINLLRNDCDYSQTSYNHIQYIEMPLTDHDITTSQKWIHDAWVDEIREFCIFKFKQCT